MSTQTATLKHGAIESAQIERVDGGAGEKLYDIRIGGKRLASVGTYQRAKKRALGTTRRWYAANLAGVRVDAATRNEALVIVLCGLGYDHADAAAVAPRISIL